MSKWHVNSISNRLSLRSPQRESLALLEKVCELIDLKKDTDLARSLEVITAEFPTVEDFERDFPSLCFALATGVGKTRLMGAFIAYLYQARGIRNFFVLAPNLTIYNKLIADFSPGSAKYVFKGIGEFATNQPVVITGDTYESAVAARGQLFDVPDDCHINIFNVSKINSEVRGGKSPRIKRLSEYIGQSYFDYLAGLDDLVMLMDESHRYRASAGIRAINELKPVLGLELTATPQVERGQSAQAFRNVIYSYPLSTAMDDGFVKEPAVATRENFDANAYTVDQLETIKLEDGVRIHENTKVELEVYARNKDESLVKPFLLVVAKDTSHANDLQQVIQSDDFFDGRYRDKVIQVHSKQSGEEKDDVVAQLLTVEQFDNPIEIVIHVNMLKEGWDVTNLYTIVPLRAANSRTLVEQSIGRGLRLPYGRRVGVPAVDRLTIVSHDKFQEIVDHANDPNSIIRTGVVIGRDIPAQGKKAVEVKTVFEEMLTGNARDAATTPKNESTQPIPFTKPGEQETAKAVYQVLQQFERLKGTEALQSDEVQQQIVTRVERLVQPNQGHLEGIAERVDIPKVTKEVTGMYQAMSIDIPRITIVPSDDFSCGYKDFNLDASNINLQPVSKDILVRHLHDHQNFRLQDGSGIIPEARPEDYLVRGLVDFDDISYDDHKTLLYKLAGQAVTHLRSYLATEDDVTNVLQYHQQVLVNLIHVQLQQHFYEKASHYVPQVTRGFHVLRATTFLSAADENERSFRAPIPEGLKSKISSMIFGGFAKCLYPQQKFDSDSERRLSVILEDDAEVLKWFKPAKGQLQIHYHQEHAYEPDFVVETKSEKLLCEPKRSSELQDETVLAKAKAAAVWCLHASAHAKDNGGKPWRYLLIPHDEILDNKNLAGLAAKFTYSVPESE